MKSALLVGHNPTMFPLAVDLVDVTTTVVTATALEAHGFPTCALAVLAARPRRWEDVARGRGTLLGVFTAAVLSRCDPALAARVAQMVRRIAASPCPPPPQRLTAAVPPPRRFSSSSAVKATRVPDIPTGWPSAIAPPLTLTTSLADAEVVGRGDADRGERLVDLEEVDVGDAESGLLQCDRVACDGWWRSDGLGPATWP